MIRYILQDIETSSGIPRYVKSYLPPTEKCPLPMLSYTRYKHMAQVFTKEEVNAIPDTIGKAVEIHM